MSIKLQKIINSGQSGAEQGALAASLIMECPTGGYIPQNYKTSTGDDKSLSLFKLTELETDKFSQCVKRNIEDADGTILFVRTINNPSKSVKYIMDYSEKMNKKVHIINILDPIDHRMSLGFLSENRIKKLHVSGAIDSEGKKGTFNFVLKYMKTLLDHIVFDSAFDRQTVNFTSGVNS